MTSPLFTLVFLIFLLLSFGTGAWLSLRHIRHIAANRHSVPAEFAESISLEAHQKAADYTIARNRLSKFSNRSSLNNSGSPPLSNTSRISGCAAM